MIENNDQPENPDSQEHAERENSEPSAKRGHVLTAKDAGWLSPGIFVAPARFVTLDPPVPKNRRQTP